MVLRSSKSLFGGRDLLVLAPQCLILVLALVMERLVLVLVSVLSGFLVKTVT